MENGSTVSSGNRTVDFSIDGPGVLTVAVPYTLSLTGESGNCIYCYSNDHATINGNASFYSFLGNASSNSYSNASFSLTNDYWNPSPDSQSGTLVFGIFASGPGYGSLGVSFDLSAQGVSVVPEPETYAMLLSGLFLISGIAWRRSRYLI